MACLSTEVVEKRVTRAVIDEILRILELRLGSFPDAISFRDLRKVVCGRYFP